MVSPPNAVNSPSSWHPHRYRYVHWHFRIASLSPIAATAKAVAATVEEIAEAIAAGGWVVQVILAEIIIMFVVIIAVVGYCGIQSPKTEIISSFFESTA